MDNAQFPVWPGWETVRLIGRGSFGSVYEIERDMFGEKEKAAMKVISIPQNSSDLNEMRNDGYDDKSIMDTIKGHVQSIVSEYSLMRKMNGNVNVVNCDDMQYLQHADGIGWDIYIRMELLTPLADSLPAQIPEETAVRIGTDICKALVLCKKHDIIHRDIKPQNIFVSPNGDYKLGDFGIAKTVEKTSGGTKIGTYKYIAPEVYNNQPYGASADIYSLGLVLYWLLNERRTPFLPLPPNPLTAGMDETARNRRLTGEPIPAPKNGSAEHQRIVLKACAYDPAARYHSAAEMLEDLQGLQTGKTLNIQPSAPAEPQPDDDRTMGAWNQKEKHPDDDRTMGAWNLKEKQPDDDRTMGAWNQKEKQPDDDRTMGAWNVKQQPPVEDSDETEGTIDIFHVPSTPVSEKVPKITEASSPRKLKAIAIAAIVIAICIVAFFMVTKAIISGGNISGGNSLPFTKVGNIVTYGHYEQDNNIFNGKEPIEWIVLDVQGNKALLISKYGLDAQPYNTEYADVTWETCTLRDWLNSTFLYAAFTATERNAIVLTEVDNGKSQCYSGWDTNGGNNMQDQIFLLSYAEASRYFGVEHWEGNGASNNMESRVAPTAYAVRRGAWTSNFDKTAEGTYAGSWWLRSPGYNQNNAAYVRTDGSLLNLLVNRDYSVVRPAFWLDTSGI